MQVMGISEHSVRRVLVPKRKEVTEGCRRLQNGERHHLHSSADIRTNKARRMRWVGDAEC